MKELQVHAREVAEGVTVLTLRGHLDGETSDRVKQAITTLSERGHNRIVVDCDALERLSHDGMGVFLQHLIRIRKSGGDIRFARMSEELRSVLSVLGLVSLVVVRDTVEEAVAEFVEAEKKEKQEKQADEGEKLRITRTDLDDGVTVATLDGFIDRHTLEILDRSLLAILDDDRPRIVIDCEKLTYISSNGMGVFISYVNKARNQGGDIRFCNMRDIARTVITMLGLHRLFEIYESREEAVGSFR